jgi:GNAT superfamily N-acetyltransferase
MAHLEIRQLTAEDDTDTGIDQVAMTIARAFADLEVAEWLVPDPTERVGVLAAQFAMLVEAAAVQGEVLLGRRGSVCSGGIHAAAVWYPERVGPHMPPDDYDERLAQACGPHIDRFRRLDDAFADHHPASYPHYCLTHLATLPEHQGRGLGRALLRYTHRTLDHAGLPSYLVASNTRTRDLYARHGYAPCLPLQLPDGLHMWPMWREPQPPTGASSPEQSTAPAEAER